MAAIGPLVVFAEAGPSAANLPETSLSLGVKALASLGSAF
jgi:hypothetical protein